MKRYHIRVTPPEGVLIMDNNYNLEPFYNTNPIFKRRFFKECENVIFKEIGKEHISKILYFFKEFESDYLKVDAQPEYYLKGRALLLLKLISYEKFFEQQNSVEELINLVGEYKVESSIWKANLNPTPKLYSLNYTNKLKDTIWRTYTLKVEIEPNKYLRVFPNVSLNIKHPIEGDIEVKSDNLINQLLNNLILELYNEQKINNTDFYKELFNSLIKEKGQVFKPNIYELEKKLTPERRDFYWNDTTKLAIHKICTYLNSYTHLKFEQKSENNLITKQQKFFLFDLLLLVGLINEFNDKTLKSYTKWTDYTGRKRRYFKKAAINYKINAIDKILRT